MSLASHAGNTATLRGFNKYESAFAGASTGFEQNKVVLSVVLLQHAPKLERLFHLSSFGIPHCGRQITLYRTQRAAPPPLRMGS